MQNVCNEIIPTKMADTLHCRRRICFEGKLRLTLFSMEDMFGILTTGYGKSSCCACLSESLAHPKKQIQNILWSLPFGKVRLHLSTNGDPHNSPATNKSRPQENTTSQWLWLLHVLFFLTVGGFISHLSGSRGWIEFEISFYLMHSLWNYKKEVLI